MSFIKTSKQLYRQVEALEKETSDHEIAMARSELEGIADKATATSSMLEGMTESGNPLPAWVQSKITNASDYITSVHDYLKYNPKINESFTLEETTFEKIYQMQQDGKSAEDIAKELKLKPDLVKKVLGESKVISEGLSDAQIAQLKKEYEPLKGKTITTAQYQQLKNILFKLQDGDLEKLQKQNIPFASTGAGSILRVRKSPVKITNVTVPGLEGMAEESGWWHDGKTGYVRASDEDKKLIDWLKKNGYKPEKKEEIIKESKASDEAKKKGLEYYGFGRYGKDKTVTHKSIGGSLKELPKDQQTKVDNKDIKKEPENTSKDNQTKVDDKEKSTKKPVDHKDTVNAIKGLEIDDLNVEDDKNSIFITKEFDYEMDNYSDAKATYMDIVKSLNKQGINYRPNPKQDIEVDKDNEYMQINFAVKKEAVDMSKVTKYKMISIKGDQKIITIDRSDLEKYLKLGYVIHEPLTEEIVVDKPAILKSLQDRLKKLESDPDHGGKQDMIAYVKSKIKMLQSKKEEAELKPVPSLEDSAKKHKVDIEVLKKQLEKGIQVEKEHTKDEKTAEKIALAHIDERPDYYDQLAKVEKQPVKESHFAIGQHVIYHGPKNPITPIKAQIIGIATPQTGAYYQIKKDDGETTYAAPDQMKLQEATFDVRLDVDGGVDTRSADTVAKMLKDKGIMAKVEPSERDSKAVTIDTSASKDKVVSILGNIVDEACWTGYKQVGMKKKNGKEVPNCVPEETLKEQKRLYIESIVAVKNKAEKSGMPYSILKQVYDRGMAAWKGGHRPGATQVQWALARVNSFVTKSSGTWGGADSDLAKKVKGD